jgi:hypothetical protein
MGESEENALEEGIFQLEPRKKGYRPTLLIKRFATAPFLYNGTYCLVDGLKET